MINSYTHIWDAVPMLLIINVLPCLPTMCAKALKSVSIWGYPQPFFPRYKTNRDIDDFIKIILKGWLVFKQSKSFVKKSWEKQTSFPQWNQCLTKSVNTLLVFKGSVFFFSFLISVTLFTLQTWHRERIKMKEDWERKRNQKRKLKSILKASYFKKMTLN